MALWSSQPRWFGAMAAHLHRTSPRSSADVFLKNGPGWGDAQASLDAGMGVRSA